MNRYLYVMTQRPATPGAMPHDGLREILEGTQEISEIVGHRVYNILVYDRRLTAKEMLDYELTSVSFRYHRVIA